MGLLGIVTKKELEEERMNIIDPIIKANADWLVKAEAYRVRVAQAGIELAKEELQEWLKTEFKKKCGELEEAYKLCESRNKEFSIKLEEYEKRIKEIIDSYAVKISEFLDEKNKSIKETSELVSKLDEEHKKFQDYNMQIDSTLKELQKTYQKEKEKLHEEYNEERRVLDFKYKFLSDTVLGGIEDIKRALKINK